VDIVAFSFVTKEKRTEFDQIPINYETTRLPPRVLVPPSMENTEPINSTNNTSNEVWNLKPDFGGLIITLLEDGEQRFIKESDREKTGHVFTSVDYDDDSISQLPEWAKSYFIEDDEKIHNANCRKPLWYDSFKPNCNNFHEVNVGLGKYLASGHYRDAFSVLNNTVVLKVTKLDQPYDYEITEMMRIDAMVGSL